MRALVHSLEVALRVSAASSRAQRHDLGQALACIDEIGARLLERAYLIFSSSPASSSITGSIACGASFAFK